MTIVQVVHTADLDVATRCAARALLDSAFDDMADSDWEHALGGIHALAWDGSELVAHASVVQRRLLHGGRALRTGYIEAVAVRADRRRQGFGGAVMEPIERIVAGAYDLGALGAAESGKPFYAARRWTAWQGRAFALTPAGIVRTADEEGDIHVLPGKAPVDVSGDLTCDWRDGDLW